MKKYLIMLLILVVIFIVGCDEQANMNNGLGSEVEWRCNSVQCAQVQNIDGTTWAQQNCQITQEGTLCQVTFDNGQQSVVPIENINLSAIQAQQCTEFVCVEEVPYKKTNYTMNLTNQ